MKTVLVEATVHGRVLVSDPTAAPARGALVGFHGYGQNAAIMLEEMRRIPGGDAWRLVSVQALHPFYARNDQAVVASWMTRQDRELAIADNIEYVNRAVAEILGDAAQKIAFVGFSQGASMAARAAVRGRRRAAGLILLGGDIPPDARDQVSAVWPPVLIGCGDRDTWYGERLDSDRAFLQSHGVPHEIVRFAGGHEFTDEFRRAVGEWIARLT